MSFFSKQLPPLKNYRFYLSLLLGGGFGLAVYSYWLVTFLPPVGRQIIFYTLLASLIGVVGYFLLLELWIAPYLLAVRGLFRWILIALSVVIAFLSMFYGADLRNSTSSYITFLLPRETLRITVSIPPGSKGTTARILWFATSTGEVSYDSTNYRGWQRKGDELVMVDASNNSLEWTGQTGEQALIVFLRSPQGGVVNIAWNGVSRTINLASGTAARYQYTQRFDVPFYASRTITLLLAYLNFFMIYLAIILLIWSRRTNVLNHLHRVIPDLRNQLSDRKPENAILLDFVIVVAVIATAMLLRGFNLENLVPYRDEYTHLLAAKAVVGGTPVGAVYQRGLLIVTLPVTIFFRIFGAELWSARLPGVIFNSLAIIPLYLATKKINRPIALLSCALYATSPWIIAVSRNVREYAYYPFYFYWIIYGMVAFLELVPRDFNLAGDLRKISLLKAGALGLVLTLPVIYALVIDPTSTFKLILISYGVFFLLLLSKFDLTSRVNIRFLAVMATGFLIGGYILASRQTSILSLPNFDDYSIRYFFPNPPQQWYFDRLTIMAFFALIAAIFMGAVFFRDNVMVAVFVILYIAFMLFFTLFFDRYIRPRYIYAAQLWYVVVMAIGLYGIWSGLQLFIRKKPARILAALLLVGLTFNVPQVLLSTFYNAQGDMPITEEIHYNVVPAYLFLLDKAESRDVLISTDYRSYVLWMGVPKFQETYSYSYKIERPRDNVLSVVERYNSGWIVLDTRSYSISDPRPLPKNSFIVGDKRIEYLGLFSDQYIWRWHIRN